MSWIDDVVDAHEYSESPERYYYWSAMAILSAIAGMRLYLERYYYKLYPNIYVILVSSESGMKKGVPVAFANRILKKMDCTRVIKGRNSIQSIIKEFSMQITLESGMVLSNAQGILLSGELDTLLVKDTEALTILTDLHNTHEHNGSWTNSLKGGKDTPTVETLKNPCICLLGASNEVLLSDLVQNKDVEGGFMARSFIVYESKRKRINDLMDKPPAMIVDEYFLEHLKEVQKLSGEFVITHDGKNLYREWYKDLADIEAVDKTGSLNRLGDQVLKAAMMISLANRLTLVITKADMDEAITKSQECVTGTRKVTMGSGSAPDAASTGRILKYLLESKNGEAERTKMLQKLWPDVDHIILDKVIDTLTQAGSIDTFRPVGKGIHYKLKKAIADRYNQFKGDVA